MGIYIQALMINTHTDRAIVSFRHTVHHHTARLITTRAEIAVDLGFALASMALVEIAMDIEIFDEMDGPTYHNTLWI